MLAAGFEFEGGEQEGFQDFAVLAENHESAFEEFHVVDSLATSSEDGIPVLSIGAAKEFRIEKERN